MPFAAREDEGWRLCLRRGKTIFYIHESQAPDIVIEFPSQAQAKNCADDLNLLWKDYEKTEKKGQAPDWDVFTSFLDSLVKHNGISAEDRESILNALR